MVHTHDWIRYDSIWFEWHDLLIQKSFLLSVQIPVRVVLFHQPWKTHESKKMVDSFYTYKLPFGG